jgi:hypothetical protein
VQTSLEMGQSATHALDVHVCPLAQVTPHPPQLFGSDVVWTHSSLHAA